MSELELKPGQWFTSGSGQVLSAAEYHAHHLSVTLWTAEPRGANPPPSPPPHLGSDWRPGAADRTPRGLRRLARAEAKWIEEVDAWVRRGKPMKAPMPPQGSVLIAGPSRKFELYTVGRRARPALAQLRGIVVALKEKPVLLRRASSHYLLLRRRGRLSLGEVAHGRVRIDRAEEVQATKGRPRAEAARDAATTAKTRAARKGEEARRDKVTDDRLLAALAAGAELSAFCLEAGEEEPIQSLAAAFVTEFGPLIQDFGAWCSDTEYGAFVSRHPVSSLDLTSPLLQLGHERFLWPEPWRNWAIGSYRHAARRAPVPLVPPPAGFYVWAALMLTALSDHPEWPGCQLFLSNRLASLRLVDDAAWAPWLVEHHKPPRGRRFSARLHGELLDYLALAAAYRSSAARADELRTTTCAYCGTPFLTGDGRRRYCDRCSSPQTHNAVAQQRYRDRHKSKPV
jgi:hypothetical protein